VSARSNLVPAHAVSPTSLESWATCPFQYFLGHVLRIGTVERPEETETISALDRGTLVHGVLEEFLRTVAPRVTPDQVWSPDEHALLVRIAVRHADEAEAAGLTGRPLLWKLARRQIMREVLGFLARDEELRRTHGVLASAAGVELAFGLPGASTPAVPVDLAGATVEFRGRIDRIDQSPDGSKVVVYDYKTGRSTSSPELAAALGRGTKLQLAIYALAARRMAPDASVEAYYWYLRNGEVGGYPLDAEHEAVFGAVAGEIVQGIEHGVFPAYPGEPRVDRHSWDNCLYCPFDQVCPPGRAQTWERMRDDPQVVGFRRLAEPDEDSD
jgi:ATP-dependent helicase/DNAse subunit B